MSEQYKPFNSFQESHQHSLETLELLYEYDDFMESVGTVIDIGCGSEGLDIEWWATRTTRDEEKLPLNIDCTGIDLVERCASARLPNVRYQRQDFEIIETPKKRKYDVLWCHDSFQYSINPLLTLARWWEIASDNGMLVIIVPQTTNLVYNKREFEQFNGAYFHYTMPNLIHMLAVNGWDCHEGHFLKRPDDPWLYAIAYKSQHAPMDPKTTTWYDLMDKKLLPESAEKSIMRWGHLKQNDLVLTWLDKSITWLGKQ